MPGIQDRNSNPDSEFSNAKFERFLSKVDDPAIIVFLLNKGLAFQRFRYYDYPVVQ